MPTFTAIAIDRLLEPGASRSSSTKSDNHGSKVERLSNQLNGGSGSYLSIEKQSHWTQISPALYVTPEATPLPDSPSSFPPSPYIVNHKRRGPGLLKSSSQAHAPSQSPEQGSGEEKVVRDEGGGAKEVIASASSLPVAFEEGEHVNGVSSVDNGFGGASDGMGPKRGSESTDFFDPQESIGYASNTDGDEDGGVEHSFSINTQMAEFFDACEELSSESGTHSSLLDIEAEMREIRLSLLMEIEKRKQAEEALIDMQNQWRRIAQHFSGVGLTLPPDPTIVEDEQSHAELAEELCRQVHIARFVSESVGRGTAKAEVEMEMEAQMESKNFEISRLCDRLHYYEAMNREMSQRNQETIERAWRHRQRRRRRQRWHWALVAAAITIGTGALAWSYLPPGKGSSSSNHFQSQEENDVAK